MKISVKMRGMVVNAPRGRGKRRVAFGGIFVCEECYCGVSVRRVAFGGIFVCEECYCGVSVSII